MHSGFRSGRSPDVLAVTAGAVVAGGSGPAARGASTPWPSSAGISRARVPIAFGGSAVEAGSVPDGAGLDRIAPTEAELMSFARPHPEVRSGTSIETVTATRPPRLTLQIVWKGVGSDDLEADPSSWPNLKDLMASGASTMDGETGSLPVDPAATLTTIGTGGLPYQHGITSRVVLNDSGRLVRAWGPGAPLSVIATLSDDLDDSVNQRARIGLVADDRTDRGAIGGNWYINADTDDVAIVPASRIGAEARRLIDDGFGADSVPDILTVVEDGSIEDMDADLKRLAGAAEAAAPGATAVVVTATGSLATPSGAVVPAARVEKEVEHAVPGPDSVVEAAAPGGLYLDQKTLADDKITDDAIIEALEGAQSQAGGPLMDQVFPAIAVSFSRYC